MADEQSYAGIPPLYFIIRSKLTPDYALGVDRDAVILMQVKTDDSNDVPFPYNIYQADFPQDAWLWRLTYIPAMRGFAMINKKTGGLAMAKGKGQPIALLQSTQINEYSTWTLGGPTQDSGFSAVRPAGDDEQNLNIANNIAGQGVVPITYQWGGGTSNELWEFLPVFTEEKDSGRRLRVLYIVYSDLQKDSRYVGISDQGAELTPIVTNLLLPDGHLSAYDFSQLFTCMMWPATNGFALVNLATGNAIRYGGHNERPVGVVPFYRSDRLISSASHDIYGFCNLDANSTWIYWNDRSICTCAQTNQGLNVSGAKTDPGRPIITYVPKDANSHWTIRHVHLSDPTAPDTHP